MFSLDELKFSQPDGLIPVLAQDASTGRVLMLAYADREALEKTVATGEMHYRSRSRGLWHKGSTSGNFQRVVELSSDCDNDSVLAQVLPAGPACHEGSDSCFANSTAAEVFGQLDQIIGDRTGDRSGSPSYTRKLLADKNLRVKKLGEEMAELVAAVASTDAESVCSETADVIYHVLVSARAEGVKLDAIQKELLRRMKNGE